MGVFQKYTKLKGIVTLIHPSIREGPQSDRLEVILSGQSCLQNPSCDVASFKRPDFHLMEALLVIWPPIKLLEPLAHWCYKHEQKVPKTSPKEALTC